MDAVTGALGRLPSMLLELLNDEYKLQKGVRAEAKLLSQELESMHAALRTVVAVPPDQLDGQVKDWADEVRDKSYDIEDILDAFLVRVQDHDPAAMSRLNRAMNKMGGVFTKAKARHDIAAAIEDIRGQLLELAARRDRYRIHETVVPKAASATSVDPRLPTFYTKASQLVGIDEPRDALLKMLDDDSRSRSSKETKIISIVGLGGLGKTTLAKAVYEMVISQFDCRAFVPVGQKPDPRKILRDILFDLQVNDEMANVSMDRGNKSIIPIADVQDLDERQLINKLQAYLEGKRYFIVIDDIWETTTWGIINNAFVQDNQGSRIIATTRISQVSKEIGEVYRMQELSDDNSKKLFYAITTVGEEKHPHNDELDEVTDTIIQKCRGVPLAIVTIAGVLAKKPTEEWYNVYNSIGFGPEDDKVQIMKKIISFSYYDLPFYLRACLLYLSVFPEECVVEKRELILRWLAEGFIHEGKGREVFEVGDGYLHELINRSMVIPVEDKSSGLLHGCRVHDMVLRVIRSLSTEENFLVLWEGEQRPLAQGNVRRLALQVLRVKTDYKDMPQVRSFNAIICATDFIPPVCSFKVLRVLVLEFCIGMEGYSLDHIVELLHLRYLGLTHTPVSKLPKKMGRLKFLHTLLLDDTGIEELPASVGMLTKLMCLRVDKKTRVPNWIGKLTSLVELEMYHGGLEVDHGTSNKCSATQFVKELGNLKNLRVLKTGVNLQNQEEGRDLLESLKNMHKIETIAMSSSSAFLEMDEAMEPNFALSSSLRVLQLLNLEFSRLPAWINAQCLPNLCQLKVVVSDAEEQDLGVLGKFRELRDLTLLIIRVHRLKLTTCGSGGFHNLISMDVTVPLQFVQGAMPMLETINFVVPVMELKDANISLQFGLENLSSLRIVKANFDCAEASQEEVEEAEAAVTDALNIHPNQPRLAARRVV